MAIRILALVGDAYGGQGGIARYNCDLFQALSAAHAEILVMPRLGDATGVLPPGVRQWPAIRGRLAFSLASLWRAWRHRPIDVVFCGHVFMAPLALALSRLLGARLWLQAHGTEIWRDRRPVVRRAIEAADQMTTVSRGTRKLLLAWAAVPSERVRVLPNTVNERFVPGPPSQALRARLRLGCGPILLTVGRLASGERYKGHELIFSALPVLRSRFPGLVHAVAGDGDDRKRLEACAAELAGDSEAVRFLGFVPDDDLPDLYRLADLFVMPSSEEGFGIVYLEAAACGLRVVGGVGGGSADAIPNSEIGVLVDSTDRDGLIAAVTSMLRQGRTDGAAVGPYRRPHFEAMARLLLARLMAQPHRKRSAP